MQLVSWSELIIALIVYEIYVSGNTEQKRAVIGSIFPEKFRIENYCVRTARMNEVVNLLYKLDARLGGNKNGKKLEKTGLSGEVARRGFEPRQTEPKSVVLPLYY